MAVTEMKIGDKISWQKPPEQPVYEGLPDPNNPRNFGTIVTYELKNWRDVEMAKLFTNQPKDHRFKNLEISITSNNKESQP